MQQTVYIERATMIYIGTLMFMTQLTETLIIAIPDPCKKFTIKGFESILGQVLNQLKGLLVHHF